LRASGVRAGAAAAAKFNDKQLHETLQICAGVKHSQRATPHPGWIGVPAVMDSSEQNSY